MEQEPKSSEDATTRELARSGVEAIFAREALLHRLRHNPDPNLAKQQRQLSSGPDHQRPFPTPGSRHSDVASIQERTLRARNKGLK